MWKLARDLKVGPLDCISFDPLYTLSRTSFLSLYKWKFSDTQHHLVVKVLTFLRPLTWEMCWRCYSCVPWDFSEYHSSLQTRTTPQETVFFTERPWKNSCRRFCVKPCDLWGVSKHALSRNLEKSRTMSLPVDIEIAWPWESRSDLKKSSRQLEKTQALSDLD